jgi:hypothetical protein
MSQQRFQNIEKELARLLPGCHVGARADDGIRWTLSQTCSGSDQLECGNAQEFCMT